MATKKVTRFIFRHESLLGKAAVELKHWGINDRRWWFGSTANSLCTDSSDVIDVITETFGFNGGDGSYAWEKIAKEGKDDEG